ncbi:hypothetical protein C8R45DRAFT_942580 [Mycena sanguinolenta]|nr:hypothetical protein C8R45DRAFT_942580 [Mycena sanguinolenta]
MYHLYTPAIFHATQGVCSYTAVSLGALQDDCMSCTKTGWNVITILNRLPDLHRPGWSTAKAAPQLAAVYAPIPDRLPELHHSWLRVRAAPQLAGVNGISNNGTFVLKLSHLWLQSLANHRTWKSCFMHWDFTGSEHAKLGLESLGAEELKLRQACMSTSNTEKNTWAVQKIKDVQNRIQNYVKKYCNDCAVMIALGCNPEDPNFVFPELKDEDLYTKNVNEPHNLGYGKKGYYGNMTPEEEADYKESNDTELVQIWSDRGKKSKFWGKNSVMLFKDSTK